MSFDGKSRATLSHQAAAVGDLVADDLIVTVTAITGKNIYLDSVRGYTDTASVFSITDSGGKVILKERLPADSVINLGFNQLTPFDFADAGTNLVVNLEGDATPLEVYLQVNAYSF